MKTDFSKGEYLKRKILQIDPVLLTILIALMMSTISMFTFPLPPAKNTADAFALFFLLFFGWFGVVGVVVMLFRTTDYSKKKLSVMKNLCSGEYKITKISPDSDGDFDVSLDTGNNKMAYMWTIPSEKSPYEFLISYLGWKESIKNRSLVKKTHQIIVDFYITDGLK